MPFFHPDSERFKTYTDLMENEIILSGFYKDNNNNDNNDIQVNHNSEKIKVPLQKMDRN